MTVVQNKVQRPDTSSCLPGPWPRRPQLREEGQGHRNPKGGKISGIPARSSLGEAVLAKLLLYVIVTLGASGSKT